MPHQGRRRLRKAGLVDLRQGAQSVVFHHSLALIVFRRKCPAPNQLPPWPNIPRGRIDAGTPGRLVPHGPARLSRHHSITQPRLP